VLELNLSMSRTFDVGINTLAGQAADAPAPVGRHGHLGSFAAAAGNLAPALDANLTNPAVSSQTSDGKKSFYLETFGCQMNAHDSEKVSGVLLGRGYRAVESPALADLVLYNTCSIREKAAQKVFARLGDWKTVANGKIIGVLGCVAQQEGEEIFERAPWVSLVCGSASYRKLPELLAQLEAGGRRVTGLDLGTDATFETEITRRDNLIRAYITIIEGCDYSCAYCVVPHTRGPERSRASDAVIAETKRLADAGYTEIQLLGQTVNSYRDPSPRKWSFVDLLRAVATLCDHVHLPVQSGSDRVLRAMRRTYTREEYLQKIEWIRAAKRPISVTSDIIVGFPGETVADFEESLTLLDAAQYDAIFSFTYSPRPNTSAKDLPDAVPEEEKSHRLAVLNERQRQIQIANNEKVVGETFEVLVDARHAARGQWTGRSTSNRLVNFTSTRENLLGEYISVRVTRGGPNSLVGEHVL
jgi:tRNA-2-methylthio-N6-dimethylallyladenosine synthase